MNTNVPVAKGTPLHPRIEEWRDLNIIFENDLIRMIVIGVPRFYYCGHQTAKHDTMADIDFAELPLERLGEQARLGIGGLLEIDVDINSVSKEKCTVKGR